MSLIEIVLIEHGYKGELEDRDQWVTVLCPYHNESRPSARVNTALNGFRCHGCGMSGNPVTLIMRKEDIAYGDAKRRLETIATEYGEEIPTKPTKSTRAPRFGIPTQQGTNGRNDKTVRPRFGD